MLLCGAVFSVFISIFIWPTQYRYDSLIDNGNTYSTCFNRFSGTSELFVPQRGWIHLGGPSPTPKMESVISADELGKLDGTLKITNYGWINADI